MKLISWLGRKIFTLSTVTWGQGLLIALALTVGLWIGSSDYPRPATYYLLMFSYGLSLSIVFALVQHLVVRLSDKQA